MLTRLAGWVLIFGLLAISGCASVYSMPASNPRANPDANSREANNQGDFVSDDSEYQRIMRQLEAEALNSIKDPRNYVNDDVPLDEIIRNFSSEEVNTDKQKAAEAAETHQEETVTRLESGPESLEDLIDRESGDNSGSPGEAATENFESVAALAQDPESSPALASMTTTSTTQMPVITSEEEFQEVLNQLREEALNSISHPMNYAVDDSEVEQFAERIGDLNLENLIERWNKNQPLIFEYDECPICRDDIQESDEFQFEPCSHKFHRGCFYEWIGVSNDAGRRVTCPVCRRESATQNYGSHL